MNNRINLLFDSETLEGVKKCQRFLREKKTTTTIKWLIESSLIYIEEGKVSPIVELCHKNKEQINAQRTDLHNQVH
jgi:hypothetical protein